MAMQTVSRTQRRLEKKQALILLALILAVSLVSFTLGVMVGKGGSGEPVVQSSSAERMPVVAVPAPASSSPAENLTFYDSLPTGEQPPLGSGINLPQPEVRPEAPALVASKPEAKVKPSDAVKVKEPSVAPAVANAGAWEVQAASFQNAEDARKLQAHLTAKGYGASVKAADLGEKGTWHRVMVGAYATGAAAQEIAERLKREEKLIGLVRKK
jgi:cell division septation protein DedD